MKKPVIHEALFRLLAPVFFGLLVYLMLLLMNNQTAQLNQLFRSQEMYICMFLSLVLFESLRLAILTIEKRLLAESYRWWLLALVVNPLALLLVLLVTYGYYVFVIGFAPGRGDLWRFVGLYMPGGWFYLALYASQYYLHKENKAQLAAEEERKFLLEQEFSDFNNELSPALLYKSLEELLLLIHTNATAADDFVGLLAHHYRYRLLNRKEEVVSLEAEMEASCHYLQLMQKIRRQEINLTLLPARGGNHFLPPGSLQIAIQWLLSNSLQQQNTLELVLEQYENKLTISLQALEVLLPDADSNYALERLQRSYRILSNQKAELVRKDGWLSLHLPLLQSLSQLP